MDVLEDADSLEPDGEAELEGAERVVSGVLLPIMMRVTVGDERAVHDPYRRCEGLGRIYIAAIHRFEKVS